MTAPRWIRPGHCNLQGREKDTAPWPQVAWAALLERDGLLERGMVHAGDLLLRFSLGTAVSYCVPRREVKAAQRQHLDFVLQSLLD